MDTARIQDTFPVAPEKLFQIITDFARYPEFLSEVKNCTVLRTDGSRCLVEYEVSVIKSFRYRLWFDLKAPTSVKWTLESGEIFKTCDGSWDLEALGENSTRATYEASASFGVFVPKMITSALLKANLPGMMLAYHRRIKELKL